VGFHFDDDGQPPKALDSDRIVQRQMSELLGLCKGVICDGHVTDGEAEGLRRWLVGNPDVIEEYPASVLAARLMSIFKDGHVDEEERTDLESLLMELTGETAAHNQPLNLSTRLPFDDPAPAILFVGYEHVFTGRMLYGTRKQCEQIVLGRGGRVGSGVTERTNYLVIGPIGSAAWLHSTHGRKILRATELRSAGKLIRIVSEEAWIQAL